MRNLVTTVLKGLGEKYAHQDAVMLVLRTGAAESGYFNQRQIGGGPGRGLWQIEPNTAKDILGRYLLRPSKSDLREAAERLLGSNIEIYDRPYLLDLHLQGNQILGIILCRLKYWPVKEPLPHSRYMDMQAQYWLTFYNAGGKGSIEHFLHAAGKAKL